MTEPRARTAVLSIRNLAISYGDVPAVSGVDLGVAPGEIVALVGESGSGKSTTAQAVLGLMHKNARITGGSIMFDGIDLADLDDVGFRKLRGSRIALIPQDPMVSLNPVRRIGDQIVETLVLHLRMPRRMARLRAIEILEESGIRDAPLRAQQYPHELSGGMKQRVLIGMALSCNPELIIADEPTSALDVTVQKAILDHLQERVAQTTAGVLFITHDLGVAADRADRIAVMSRGTIVETGRTRELITTPRDAYTRQLFEAAPSLSSMRMVRTGDHVVVAEIVPTHETAGTAVPGAVPALLATGLVKDFRVKPETNGGEPLFRAVDDVSFTIPAGRTYALVGESGSGKSTTARLALRLESTTSGTIELDGVDVTHIRGENLRQLRRKLQVVYQNPYASLDPRFTLEQIIEEPLRSFGIGDRPARRARALELLDQVALPASFAGRRPIELSGGQRQRVAIARALAINPRVVVLDEPVSALDVSVQHQILQLLTDLQLELGLSYLFISHDLAVVAQISDQVGVMSRGRLVEQGATRDVLRTPQHEYTQKLLDSIPGREAAA